MKTHLNSCSRHLIPIAFCGVLLLARAPILHAAPFRAGFEPFFSDEEELCYPPVGWTPHSRQNGLMCDLWDDCLFVFNETTNLVTVRVEQEDPPKRFTFSKVRPLPDFWAMHNRWPTGEAPDTTLSLQVWIREGMQERHFGPIVQEVRGRTAGDALLVRVSPSGEIRAEWGRPWPEKSREEADRFAKNRRQFEQVRPLVWQLPLPGHAPLRVFSRQFKEELADEYKGWIKTKDGKVFPIGPQNVSNLRSLRLPDPSLTLTEGLPDPLHVWYVEDGTCLAVILRKAYVLRYEWLDCRPGEFRLDLLYPTLPAARKEGLGAELGLSEIVRRLGPDRGPDANGYADGTAIWPLHAFDPGHNSWHVWYFDDETCLFVATTDDKIDVFEFHESAPGTFRISRQLPEGEEDEWDCSKRMKIPPF